MGYNNQQYMGQQQAFNAQQPCPQLSPVVTAPTQVVNNMFHPQAQPIVHPIEYVTKHHCVPVPQHYYTCSHKDVYAGTVYPRRTRG